MNSQRAVRRSARLGGAVVAAAAKSTRSAAKRPRGEDAAPAAKRKPAAAASGPCRTLEKRLWAKGFERVAGVDEAGRGPLAGPVVAAAAILPPPDQLAGIMPLLNDSKKLTEDQREAAFAALEAHPGVVTAAAIVDAGEIDRINILQATLKAMAQAVESLPTPADAALVDGNRLPPALPVKHAAAIVKGDAKSAAIAAASIVAKVKRDRIMAAAHARFPQYGFAQHKGYPTAAHVAAIAAHGPCELHRLTFAPLKGRY